MPSSNLLFSALLLSSHVLPTLPFSIPSRFGARGSRTTVQRQMRDRHNNDVVYYNPHHAEQEQFMQHHSTCIAKDSKIHIGVFSSDKPLVIEGELDTRELECREDILIEGKVRGNIQGGLLITINGVLDGNVDCYEVVIGPGAVVTGDVRCRDVIILNGGYIGGQLFCETINAEGNFPSELPPAPHMSHRQLPPRQMHPPGQMPPRHPSQAQAHWQANTNTKPRVMDTSFRAVAERQAAPEDHVYQEPPPIFGGSGPTMSSNHQEEIINTKAFLDRAVSRRREMPGGWKPMEPTVTKPIAPNGEFPIPRKRAVTSPERVHRPEPVVHNPEPVFAEEHVWTEEKMRAEELQRAEFEANQLFDRHDPVPPISDIPVDDEPEWANLPHQRIEIPEWADNVAPNAGLPCVDATIEGKSVIQQPYVPTSDYTVWTTETNDYATDPFAGAPFGTAAAAMHAQYDYGPNHHDDFGHPPCDEYGNPFYDDFGPHPHHDEFGSPHHDYHRRTVDESYYNAWSNFNHHAP